MYLGMWLCKGALRTSCICPNSIPTNVLCGIDIGSAVGEAAPEGERRVLEFRREDLFKSFDSVAADIIILQTDFPPQVHDSLCSMASRFRRGTRVLSYLNFHKIWDCEFFPFPFASFAPNSRFPTSWSPTNGGMCVLRCLTSA